jgi:hypothetical protein
MPPHYHFHSAAFGGELNKDIVIQNVTFHTKSLDEWFVYGFLFLFYFFLNIE